MHRLLSPLALQLNSRNMSCCELETIQASARSRQFVPLAETFARLLCWLQVETLHYRFRQHALAAGLETANAEKLQAETQQVSLFSLFGSGWQKMPQQCVVQ